MVSCLLQGGLGNQLFQVSTTLALAKMNGDKCVLDDRKCYTPNQGNPISKYKTTIFRNVEFSESFTPKTIYNEPKFSYSEIPYSDGVFLNGYFQSWKYFDTYRDYILSVYSLNELFSEVDLSDTTSVHIRRGDYLKFNDVHNILSRSYYENALSLIDTRKVLFFSDDIGWVKDNYKGVDYSYSEHRLGELYDLYLMNRCKNNIIANSSFSWWGAYLSEVKNKIIISPKKWFAEKGPADIGDIGLKNWVQI